MYDEPPIVAMVALSGRQTFPYERLLKSLLQHLVDAVTNEHVVCREFFQRTDSFDKLFSMTLQVLLEQVENYLFSCYDALCILLMIKVTHQFRRAAQSRTITSLNGFFDQLTQLLWPRLKTVMELHQRSIKQATVTSLGGVDLHGHYVSRRFAEFTCSVLLIVHKGTKSSEHFRSPGSPRKNSTTSRKRSESTASKDSAAKPVVPVTPSKATSAGDMLLQDLNEMVNDYIGLLERLSEEHTVNIKRIVFMINNLDQVVCVFQEQVLPPFVVQRQSSWKTQSAATLPRRRALVAA